MDPSDIFKNSTRVQDTKLPFIDDDTFYLLMLINPAIVSFVISVIGLGANVVNIIIFFKLGYKETVNISLTALAVSDFFSLLALLWTSISYIPSFCDLACDHIDLQYYEDTVIGDWRSYFTTVGGCITCLIAFERCLCVLMPLQVKMILTKTRLKIIIPGIFVFCLIPQGLVFYPTVVTLMSYHGSNASILEDRSEDYSYYDISQVSYGFITVLNMSTYAVVIILTALIVWKLTSQSRWRKRQLTDATGIDTTSGKQDDKKGLSEKDRRATMTVTIIAAMYIIGFLPGTALYFAMTLAIEFNKGRQYSNLYDFLWATAYIGEGICSSANIIVYLKTSTKFRETFRTTLCWFRTKESQNPS